MNVRGGDCVWLYSVWLVWAWLRCVSTPVDLALLHVRPASVIHVIVCHHTAWPRLPSITQTPDIWHNSQSFWSQISSLSKANRTSTTGSWLKSVSKVIMPQNTSSRSTLLGPAYLPVIAGCRELGRCIHWRGESIMGWINWKCTVFIWLFI